MSSLFKCPKCNESLQQHSKIFLLPCYRCHILCEICKNHLEKLAGSLRGRSDGKKCWLFGENCQRGMHFICPQCEQSKDVFHVSKEGLMSVEELSTEDLVNAKKRVLRNIMEKEHKSLKNICGKSVLSLTKLKDELNGHTKRCRVSKIAGSSVGIVGGGMFIAGAFLAPFTLGASAVLMIAGGITGGVGGGVAFGTGIVELVINKGTAKDTQQLIEKIQEIYCRLIDHSNEYRIVDSFGHLVPGIASGSIQVLSNLGLGVFRAIFMIGRTGKSAINIAAGSARVGVTVLHSLGAILSAAAVVVDIVTIVANGIELYRGDPAEFSVQIDEAIAEINTMGNITIEELLKMHLE